MSTHDDTFPTTTTGLPAAAPTPFVELSDGDRFELRISPVAQRIGDAVVRRLAYNGSVPGPMLRVQQGSEIVVRVTNDGDVDATVHWHGLRLENRYDGVPHETQQPIPVGGELTYHVRFPDPGLYWYHPHFREDYAQDMGLSGSIIVDPSERSYWPMVDREVVLNVDDVLFRDGRLATFHRSGPDHVAMGRFGDTLLVNGQPEWTFKARRGEVVRFYLTNTANARVFDLALRRARMKLVGGDSGRYERDAFVDDVLLAPSERAVVDVRFDHIGVSTLEHRTPERTHVLGRVLVGAGSGESPAATSFADLGGSAELAMERSRICADIARDPDKVLALVAEMRTPSTSVAIDEHRGEDRDGMAAAHHSSHGAGHDHAHAPGSIEWEDTMEALNAASDPSTIHWMLVDRQTGLVNGAIDWAFRVGDRVKIRLLNEMGSDHPMPHPFHIHGAGRFLVLTRGGRVESNLIWKDTVLVRTGEVVDILLDVSNPGRWMAHCHIAEHAEGGMMFSFQVAG